MFDLDIFDIAFSNLLKDNGQFRYENRIEKHSVTRPKMDVYDRENEYTLLMEMPGVKKDDLNVTLEKGVLQMNAKVSKEQDFQDGNLIRQERMTKQFSTSIRLPQEIETEKVEATLENGLLTLRLPKTGYAKAKKIKVQ